MSQPTSPRLCMAKTAATTAAVIATTAALTAGVASSAPEALAAHNRSVQADVELTAATNPDPGKIPDIVGIYGVGPIFWAAQALGITPENVIKAAGGLTGNTELAAVATALLDTLGKISPVESGIKGPMPSDVYDAVKDLDYTATGLADMLGLGGKVLQWLVKAAPILNQRRAIVLSESLGGLTTSLAYRDMINAVQSDSEDWGEGITGQWLIFVNNPSRPGGGLFALATPLTNLFGLNLTTPDAGSYTNADQTKVLNTSILDITWAYNPLSDVPTTLNPLAWANSAAAGVFLTYLLPDEGNNITEDVLPELGGGIIDGLKVMLDPTGGQGTDMIPLVGSLLQLIDVKLFNFPGNATYITYDSGNLPLLEPFRMVPHLANLVPGVDIPTPLTDSVEDALRKMVNMGYQDVNPDTLERTFDEAGDQAYFWHSPLTPTQQLAAVQTVFDALVDGIQDNALNPEAWTPKLPGTDFKPIVQNAVSVAVAQALSDALEAIQKNAADPMFDAVEKGLAPVTHALDGINAQVESAIDGMLKVNGTTTNKSGTQSITSVPSTGGQLKTLSIEAPATESEGTATPIKDTLKDAGVNKDSLKDNEISNNVTKLSESVKTKAEAKAKARARHAVDANNPLQKSVKETVAKVQGAAKDVKDAVDTTKKNTPKTKAKAQKSEKKTGAAA
ncbi:PE-PPE domain-containing protein [Mycolicibacterium conceptionense]|uniref:PE-PPE domain-containing protein n=2 Tax=Mycobacteriaceae TaxID=1762 RepID=A0A1A2VBX6_9MYCO|nr:PE-PPE domain-containing protein [Mycolicibacterium conceptionense]OBF04991.1 PE-PPE domain-containing protein [Mycolicibacterium conceptionense]OBF16174.1 PE-PPE domain-containing protein [Mycolicibacterium conceptionense]OBF31925.1 PE-PPE domain-containing protein [Mycolicibacterium conceptionense]OBH98344.1 PE-PPE domain-containing protein [Mycolicibacterium conceptionense]